MKRSTIISLTAHASLLALLVFLGTRELKTPDETEVTPTEVIDEAEFVARNQETTEPETTETAPIDDIEALKQRIAEELQRREDEFDAGSTPEHVISGDEGTAAENSGSSESETAGSIDGAAGSTQTTRPGAITQSAPRRAVTPPVRPQNFGVEGGALVDTAGELLSSQVGRLLGVEGNAGTEQTETDPAPEPAERVEVTPEPDDAEPAVEYQPEFNPNSTSSEEEEARIQAQVEELAAAAFPTDRPDGLTINEAGEEMAEILAEVVATDETSEPASEESNAVEADTTDSAEEGQLENAETTHYAPSTAILPPDRDAEVLGINTSAMDDESSGEEIDTLLEEVSDEAPTESTEVEAENVQEAPAARMALSEPEDEIVEEEILGELQASSLAPVLAIRPASRVS